jgi:2-polyprenyl-3-methyl-5-hydroxy-6-metoxy-1,4-benzoquinol methylase
MVAASPGTISILCATCHQAIGLDYAAGKTPIRCTECGHTYHWDNGILLLGETGNQSDYPDESYALLADAEPRHFWFAGRNQVITATMRRTVGQLAGRSVLDIGCGTGFVLAALEQAGMTVCGLDMHMAGLRYARQRTHGLLVCETATRVPFVDQFDVVMLCDVIEHTPDDSIVLREASQALKSSGVIVVTVPANPHMWTIVDEASGHKRRYTKAMLTAAMEQAGLHILTMHYFNNLLYPVQALQRRLLKRRALASADDRLQIFHQSLRVPPPLINATFRIAMAADIPLSYLPIPFGASLIAVGERRE